MTRDAKNLIVGLDIGTSKVVAVVAEVMPDGSHEIIGMGQHESRGLKKGMVVNIESTVDSIQKVLEEAELKADCKIGDVYTGVAGGHIRSFNSTGMVAIKDKEVSQMDVARAMETARAINIPTDQKVLGTVKQEFVVDGQDGVREPIGMSGIRLEVRVHNRNRCGGGRAKHRQVHSPLRAGSKRTDSAADCFCRCGADRR